MSFKFGDALVYLAANRDGLDRDLRDARRQTDSWVKSVGQGIAQGLGQQLTQLAFQGVQAIGRMVKGAASAVSAGAIGGNAAFEQYNQQFAVLLKSAGAAQQRMEELERFGRTTPFDLPGVVQADLILQGFGLHAEEAVVRYGRSGAEIRRISGDVAAGTSATFEEITGYIGRFSTGATGEAIQRFQELGIVTRRELAAMGVEFSKSGELVSPLDEAMTVLLQHLDEKYGGMMEAQSTTFNGMLSNLRDWQGNALRIIGQPTFELLKQELKGLLAFLDTPAVQNAVTGLRDLFTVVFVGILQILKGFSGTIGAFFRAIFGDFDTASQNLANNAGGWGRNVILQFARGMAAAATAVVQVLNRIGQAIAHWLRPGSPPRLLPDIDRWGTGTMQAWLDGFGSADVGVLRGMGERVMGYLGELRTAAGVQAVSSIGNAIAGLLRSTAEEDDEGLIGRILGSNEVIAQAIRDIQEFGGVGAQTLAQLETALQGLPPVAVDYVQAMLRLYQANEAVRQAQEALNRVTEEYEARLQPISRELDEIQRRRADMADEERMARLREAIASGSLSDQEKELALMELRELELRRQQRELEAEQQAAEDAAQANVDAAEEEQQAAEEAADLQAALLEQRQQSNELIQQQIALLDRLANALGGVAGGLGDAAGGGSGFDFGDPLGGMGEGLGEGLGDNLQSELDSIFENLDVDGLVTEIENIFAPLETEAGTLGDTFTTLQTNLDGFLQRIGLVDENGRPALGFMTDLKDAAIVLGGVLLGIKVGAFFTTIVTGLTAISGGAGVLGVLSAAITALGGPFVLLAAVIGAVVAIWHTDFLGIRTSAEQLWFIIQYVFGQIAAWIEEKITDAGAAIERWLLSVRKWFMEDVPAALKSMADWFTERTASIGVTLHQLWVIIKSIFQGIAAWIEEKITDAGAAIEEWLLSVRKWFTEDVPAALKSMADWFTERMASIEETLRKPLDAVIALWDKLKELWQWLKDHVFDVNLPSIPGFSSTSAAWPGDGGDDGGDGRGFGGGRSAGAAASTPPAAAAQPIVVNFYGNLEFRDRQLVDTFVDLLRGLADDASLAAFLASPIGA